MQTLSKKGVLFLTSGFHQYYIFQNLAHLIEEQNSQNQQKSLKIILSDGEIYISGLFNIKNTSDLDNCLKIKQFDLLKVFASYEVGTKPVLITSLQIFSQGHQGIYGLPPISLKDYMESRLLKSSNGLKSSQRNQNLNFFQEQKKYKIAICDNKNSIQVGEKAHKNSQKKPQNITQNIQPEPIQKQQLSFELSNEQSEYDLLNDIVDIQSKKREQRLQNHQEICNNPQKRHKPNEDQRQQGQIVIKQHQKLIKINNTNKNPQNAGLEPLQQAKKYPNPHSNQQKVNKTQIIPIKKTKQIEIIDLDNQPTQKQSIPFFCQSNRRQYRKSHLQFIEEILQSDEKETQKQTIYKRPSGQQIDSITVPRSQTLHQQTLITPTKQFNSELIFHSSNQDMMGSTTQRKKLRQQYNLLIENLYESNSSFKIICRVNNLYEWRSKNGVPCLALDLMDSIGDEIKAIVYMNHASKECKQCGSMVEVGKVYCFQNGECKRDFIEKQALELLFNLRTKTCWSKEIPCGGRNKIIPAPKIKIQPIFQNKILSISELIDHLQSGKNTLSNVYGILESFKLSQFEKNSKNNQKNTNQGQEDKSDPQIELIELQNPDPVKQKVTIKKSNVKNSNKQGPTNIYLNGFLADPIERKKIAFACIVSKPFINGTQFLTAENFLTKNGIKKGALAILHNVRIQSTNNNTVHKLEKNKRTYMQIISDRNIKWQYNSTYFAAQTVYINDIDENTQIYPTLKQILSFTQKQIDSIMENPRVVNYSKQPFTERLIFDLNQLLQKSMMPEQNCFSQIKGVKIHSIEQKPSVDICFYCKKKAKSPQQKSNSNSHAIKHCQRCKMIVKTITMHIFNIVFADDTASFLVQVTKNEYLETLLDIKIQDYLAMQEFQQKKHLDLIKYTEFSIKLRSQKKIGGIIHKINSIEKMPIKARIDEIKEQKKGLPKHYTRLDSSW